MTLDLTTPNDEPTPVVDSPALSAQKSIALLQQGAAHPFLPHPFLRFGSLQTALALVKPHPLPVYHVDQPFLIDAGPDRCDLAVTEQGARNVQLLAYFTPSLPATRAPLTDSTSAAGEPRGLVLLLHGWLGCSHSNYNLITTSVLTRAGFDVVRLNFRDHGPDLHLETTALNPGIFLGILLDEVAHAVGTIARMAGDRPFYIIGVSMGGNFALRLALRHTTQPIANLRKVIAINPAVDPARSTDNVDRNLFFRRFFRRRWLNALLRKQAHYPQLYDFNELRADRSIRVMTERIIQRYGSRLGSFQSADEYFASYAVPPATLTQLTVPTEIITALDDPIIDAAAFKDLPTHPKLTFQPHPTGGHVGYVSLFPVQHYLPRLVLHSLLDDAAVHAH